MGPNEMLARERCGRAKKRPCRSLGRRRCVSIASSPVDSRSRVHRSTPAHPRRSKQGHRSNPLWTPKRAQHSHRPSRPEHGGPFRCAHIGQCRPSTGRHSLLVLPNQRQHYQVGCRDLVPGQGWGLLWRVARSRSPGRPRSVVSNGSLLFSIASALSASLDHGVAPMVHERLRLPPRS